MLLRPVFHRPNTVATAVLLALAALTVTGAGVGPPLSQPVDDRGWTTDRFPSYDPSAVDLLAVSQTLIIDTVAGGGPNHMDASSAPLNQPSAVIEDGHGNLLLAARTQHRVFKIDGTGQLTVVSGTGFGGSNGDMGPAVKVLPAGGEPRRLPYVSSPGILLGDP